MIFELRSILRMADSGLNRMRLILHSFSFKYIKIRSQFELVRTLQTGLI